MNHPQMEKTVKLMKAKALKEHKCGPEDIVFGNPSFGEDVGHGRLRCKMKYVHSKRLLGVIEYDGSVITISPGGR